MRKKINNLSFPRSHRACIYLRGSTSGKRDWIQRIFPLLNVSQKKIQLRDIRLTKLYKVVKVFSTVWSRGASWQTRGMKVIIHKTYLLKCTNGGASVTSPVSRSLSFSFSLSLSLSKITRCFTDTRFCFVVSKRGSFKIIVYQRDFETLNNMERLIF